MPDFLYIPVASPKAYRRGKRKALQEGDEYDLNRSFLPGTQVWEARALMEFLQRYRFKLCLTIHEDDNHIIKPEEKKGFFEEWAVSQGIVERSINPEIPPSATYGQKTALVKVFLDKFLQFPLISSKLL